MKSNIYTANNRTIWYSNIFVAVLLLFCANYSFGQCTVDIKMPPTAKVTLSQATACSAQTVNLTVSLTSDDLSTVSSPEWRFTYTQNGVGTTINTASSLPYGVTMNRTGKNAMIIIPLNISIPGIYTYGISSLSDNWYPASAAVDPCNYSGTASYTVNSIMTMAACSHANTTCFGSLTGSVSAGAVSNSVGTVNYTWKNSSNVIVGTTSSVNNLPAGTYSLMVADNCTTLFCSQTITEPSAIAVANSSHIDVSCNGGNNGTITLGSVSGGTAPYVYSWTGPSGFTANTANLSGLVAGTYNYRVTDKNNCTAVTGSVLVGQPAALIATLTKSRDASCSSGTNGAATFTTSGGVNPVITWTKDGSSIAAPNLNAMNAGVYQVTVTDACGSVSRSITISRSNRAPVAAGEIFSTTAGTAINNTVATNDSDPDGELLTYSVQPNANRGTLVLQANGTFIYTPAAGFAGVDVFTYKVTDPCGASATANVSFTVNPIQVNSVPVAVNDSYSTTENVSIIEPASGIIKNDSDPEKNPLTAHLVTSTSNGSLTLNADGSFTYIPNANFFGSDSFTYRVSDGGNNSNIATVTIMVNRVTADLSISKISQGKDIKPDEVFEYQIVVENNGANNATGVVATDVLPSELKYVDASASAGTYFFNLSNRTITWNLGGLSVNSHQTLTLKVKSTKGGRIVNTATVRGNQFDPDMSNNTSTDSRLILGVFIPNVFTPNGDGVNETFVIDGLAGVENEIYIYNRWGNEVYKSRNYDCTWNGLDLPSATYYYVLKIKGNSGKWTSYSGFVEIMR
ncbi:Ig-like domain-containing protein [Solitalea lacus]|uniref:Ig-like domain-containing protein n=1 Tax=Solitalea lacus TaxID=2911172 RepID=UPI001EDBE888|nr:Ig-like domain-containing protein [Solitalea lacus]UKJ07562.1 Ig-like domain-containing protein [Solitalea lacus]